MRLLVTEQLVPPAEIFPAHLALVGLVARVHLRVSLQVGRVRELHVAVVAGVRLFPGVLPHVLVHVAPVREGLPAVAAAHLLGGARRWPVGRPRLAAGGRLAGRGLSGSAGGLLQVVGLYDVRQQGQAPELLPALGALATVRMLARIPLHLVAPPVQEDDGFSDVFRMEIE